MVWMCDEETGTSEQSSGDQLERLGGHPENRWMG